MAVIGSFGVDLLGFRVSPPNWTLITDPDYRTAYTVEEGPTEKSRELLSRSFPEFRVREPTLSNVD